MGRKPPVPEIPPVPDHQPGHRAAASRLALKRAAQQKRSEPLPLPDLLEAFWGDGANQRDAPGHHQSEPARPASRGARSHG
jgi:hypothetical protein